PSMAASSLGRSSAFALATSCQALEASALPLPSLSTERRALRSAERSARAGPAAAIRARGRRRRKNMVCSVLDFVAEGQGLSAEWPQKEQRNGGQTHSVQTNTRYYIINLVRKVFT